MRLIVVRIIGGKAIYLAMYVILCGEGIDMKNAFDKQDVFNLCVVRTAIKIEQGLDPENLEKNARVVIADDLFFDVFRHHSQEITTAAVYIASFLDDLRERQNISESTETILRWYEHCILAYPIKREEEEHSIDEEQEYVNLLGTCLGNLLAYMTGIKEGYLHVN